MDVNRSSFYKWRKRMANPSDKMLKRQHDILLFKKYHDHYPTHGYRWLNAKIALDLGVTYSNNYAQRVCQYAGIKSVSKRFRTYKSSDRFKIYPNLLLAVLSIKSWLVIGLPFGVRIHTMN